MSSLQGNPPAYPPLEYGSTGKVYQYDLRLEVVVKEGVENVAICAIFVDFAKKLRVTAGHPVDLFDVHGTLLKANEIPSEDTFKSHFCVTLNQKNRRVMMGFKLNLRTPLSKLKDCMMNDYLHPKGMFLREQIGGFFDGLNNLLLGYFTCEHPTHAETDIMELSVNDEIEAYWKTLDKDTKKKWLDKYDRAFTGNAFNLPVTVAKDRISATHPNGRKISSQAMQVLTPEKYAPMLRFLLDGVYSCKKLPNLVMYGLHRENPAGYFHLLAHHHQFMQNHRNIQIWNVEMKNWSKPGKNGKTLPELLWDNKQILRITQDEDAKKAHISVMASHYMETIQWISEMLMVQAFDYDPVVRRPQSGSKGSGGGSALPSHQSRYSTIYQNALSFAASTPVSSLPPPRPNAWPRGPPLAISYVHSDAAFPSLPLKATNDTKSTASITASKMTTVQQAIDSAITKVEAVYNEKFDALKQEMETKMAVVVKSMEEIADNAA